MNAAPIFVHSLFRSGSTYIFSVFRRSTTGYWCYQEPCHEHLRYVINTPERLLDIHSQHGTLLRHPALEKPYFWEFYQAKEAIAPLFKKQFSYDWFFIGESNASFSELRSYLQCLIDSAKGPPFLQCCRTFGHVAALRNVLGGTHIYLWRNPRDQWWSYKVGVSFDATVLLILNAMEIPPVLAAVKAICEVPNIHDEDIEREFAAAQGHCLTSRDNYFAFYALWTYAMLEVPRVADFSINIDSLSSSRSYQDSMLAALGGAGIKGLDFSDCAIVQAKFGRNDIAFFDQIEKQVLDLYLQHGYTRDDLAAVLDLRERHRPKARHSALDLAADAERVRDVAVQKNDNLAQTQRRLAKITTELAQARRVADAQRADLIEAAALSAAQQREIVGSQAALAARERELAEARARSDALAAELANVKTQVATLADDLADARTRVDSLGAELASARQHSARLHEELIAAGSRLEEAGRETDRWWTVADDASRHLATICHSRSWRLTAPLREINAWRKRALGKAEIGAATLDSLPRQAMRRVLLGAWAYARERPERRARLVRLLAPFPRLYARLRTFAFARAPAAPSPVIQLEPDTMPDLTPAINGIQWDDLPRSVGQAYRQLMEARNAPSRSADPQIRTQTPH